MSKLSDLNVFTIAESKSFKQYILLAKDDQEFSFFMEEKRGKGYIAQTSKITSTKQNASVIKLYEPQNNPETLIDFIYPNEEWEEFKRKAIDYLVFEKYTSLKPQLKKVADNLSKKNLSDFFEKAIDLKNIEKEIDNKKIKLLELKYQDASPQVKTRISKFIERGAIALEIKEAYKFKCKVCEVLNQSPHSFKKSNGDFYIETHHIEHVSSLKNGVLGVANLITVCPNHHRQFHYGNIEIEKNTKEELKLKIDGEIIPTIKKIIFD
jgi:predicted HNH restriction endonuclease